VRTNGDKEIHFFDNNFQKGLSWYLAKFPQHSGERRSQVTGEASPYYLFHPLCARRIHDSVPHVRLIAVLRDPADRAISHYFHEVFIGMEKRRPEEALLWDERAVAFEEHKMIQDEPYRSLLHRHFSYKSRGLYTPQLERYFACFAPHQILILESTDLQRHTLAVMRRVYAHLGLDPDFTPEDLRRHNMGRYTKRVPAHVLDGLREYFAPHNSKLRDWLGMSFEW